MAEAPSFPGNSRVVAAWFPAQERGTAAAIFNSAQYFATVMFAPLMGYLVERWQWESVFFVMGAIGLAGAALWAAFMRPPKQHPMVNRAELDYIAEGGALVERDQPASPDSARPIAIGYIIHATGSHNGARVFVVIHALLAAISYLVTVGRIERVTLRPQ